MVEEGIIEVEDMVVEAVEGMDGATEMNLVTIVILMKEVMVVVVGSKEEVLVVEVGDGITEMILVRIRPAREEVFVGEIEEDLVVGGVEGGSIVVVVVGTTGMILLRKDQPTGRVTAAVIRASGRVGFRKHRLDHFSFLHLSLRRPLWIFCTLLLNCGSCSQREYRRFVIVIRLLTSSNPPKLPPSIYRYIIGERRKREWRCQRNRERSQHRTLIG